MATETTEKTTRSRVAGAGRANATKHAGRSEGKGTRKKAGEGNVADVSQDAASTAAEAMAAGSEARGRARLGGAGVPGTAADTEPVGAQAGRDEDALAGAGAAGPRERADSIESGVVAVAPGAPEQEAASASAAPGADAHAAPGVSSAPAPAGPLECSVQPHHLQMGLAAVAGALPSRTSLPVLATILLAAETDHSLRLTATDLDTTVSRVIPAVITGGGAVLVAGKKLQEIVREMPANCPLDLRLLGESVHVACASTRTRYKLPSLPADEFPTAPRMAWEDAFTVTQQVLTVLIERSSYAASTEETRPILNGVLWEISETRMGMVATNGHRLASVSVACAGAPAIGEVILHPRALSLVKAQPATGEAVRVARTGNHIGFRGDGWEVITRTIEGPYPNYRQVLPQDNDRAMVVDKGVLRAAVRRMAIMASDQTHRIRLALSGSTLALSVETPDLGAANEEVPIDYQGDPLEIGFNAQYLLELLRYMPTDEVRMTFKAPERAATMEPVAWEEGWVSTALVMPLRLLG